VRYVNCLELLVVTTTSLRDSSKQDIGLLFFFFFFVLTLSPRPWTEQRRSAGTAIRALTKEKSASIQACCLFVSPLYNTGHGNDKERCDVEFETGANGDGNGDKEQYGGEHANDETNHVALVTDPASGTRNVAFKFSSQRDVGKVMKNLSSITVMSTIDSAEQLHIGKKKPRFRSPCTYEQQNQTGGHT
jgi:hypothetical protein